LEKLEPTSVEGPMEIGQESQSRLGQHLVVALAVFARDLHVVREPRAVGVVIDAPRMSLLPQCGMYLSVLRTVDRLDNEVNDSATTWCRTRLSLGLA
jgi:hypothetical protein